MGQRAIMGFLYSGVTRASSRGVFIKTVCQNEIEIRYFSSQLLRSHRGSDTVHYVHLPLIDFELRVCV